MSSSDYNSMLAMSSFMHIFMHIFMHKTLLFILSFAWDSISTMLDSKVVVFYYIV